MAQDPLQRLIPQAPRALCDILDGARGPAEAPIRSEVFGPQRFAQHGRSLGEAHQASQLASRAQTFAPRLQSNIRVLREAHAYIGRHAATGYDVSPAAEWLLDNFHLIEAQLEEVRAGLPRNFFRQLPVLQDKPLAGLPRIYGVAWAFVAHTDGAFDDDLLVQFLSAYQETRELNLGEMWALPTTLRVVLIENLRRLAERVAAHKAAREAANLCCDKIERFDLPDLAELLAALQLRGVGRMFLGQMALRLRDRGGDGESGSVASDAQLAWLHSALPDSAALLAQQSADQAADNLSVSNAVTSLRAIGDADWPDIVARSSTLMRMMLTSPVFEAEQSSTRDQTLHAIEHLARRTGRSEVAVAQTLLDLMASAQVNAGPPQVDLSPLGGGHRAAVASGAKINAGPPQVDLPQSGGGHRAAVASGTSFDPARTVADHWLHGAGRPVLAYQLGLQEQPAVRWRALGRRVALPAYLGSLLLGTLGVVAWLLLHQAAVPAGSGWPLAGALLGAALMLWPASEAVVAVINRLVSESARPAALPRLALTDGIPAEHRVLLVIPTMLTDTTATTALVRRLLLHYLANPEPQAQFALLTDWADADAASAPADAGLLAHARALIDQLNAEHGLPASPDNAAGSVAAGTAAPATPATPAAPRFILLHRPRVFSATEQRWIGWERKRGKLEQLVAALAVPAGPNGPEGPAGPVHAAAEPAFLDLGITSQLKPGARYIVTLDSDTELPPGRLRELVGVAAHPHNQPRLDASGHRVVAGYGILQPRVVTPLPVQAQFTAYHWLFAGRCGIDPYSAASSEVYQDLFGEGTFTGKGLIHVQAMQAVLAGRLPEGRVLSHDLLEGSMARCGAVTDITVIEEAPFHADVAAARLHRWTRGDWQLLPFLAQPQRWGLRAINRWKMFDNLRRSLVAPMSLALLALSLAGVGIAPLAALALVGAAFSAGPLMGAVAGLSPSRDDLAKRHFYAQSLADLARALGGGLWWLQQLLAQAGMAGDAITRTVWRLAVSQRHLLQWTTAAAAQAQARQGLWPLLVAHWRTPLAALALLAMLLLAGTPYPLLASGLCLLWATAPLGTWWVSRRQPRSKDANLGPLQRAQLADIARDTWRFFERCVGPDDKHLPPDNLQTVPHEMLAHRTSPTNIGLYLLSAACARRFGWIGTEDLLTRLEATGATLDDLQRHRGHFLNWYDTQTGAPLLPMYVSTVDSGNLCGHLLATAQACRELAQAPHDGAAAQRALDASRARLAPLWVAASRRHPARRDALRWCLADHRATLRSAALDVQAGVAAAAAAAAAAAGVAAADAAAAAGVATDAATDAAADSTADAALGAATPQAAQRLLALARRFEALAGQADFRFLYHRKRHLFHIGWRVTEQQLDAGFYDLLASESRLTSLLAIAKGDVSVRHWASLGRPFFAVGSLAGLRSWSGSMFEYLMPGLILDEPPGSVLREACEAALREQIAFAAAHKVPWGISESAYAGRDHTLAYQYAPQGVPRLALRRTPPDELVIAPYASVLAAQIAPRRSSRNLVTLQGLAARGRYGFIEALDYTSARQNGDEPFTPVCTFMSHHQGMSLVALANLLLGGTAQRWGMANPQIAAVASLLHERTPREVALLYETAAAAPLQSAQRRGPGLLREVLPGATAVEPTHLLGNGRYSVSLRANGAGWSRWGATGITRWRDDALRDAMGSFFYLRWDRQPQAVSITQHPAPDPAAQYQSLFHADRVCFDAAWPEVQAHTTVWVSPEDDIEFRRVELHNLGQRTLDIELHSVFEVTLSEPRADEAHPAFMNLFVSAEWLAAQQALVFERRPRLPTEPALRAAHFLAETDGQVVGLRIQTDRQRWLGRNHAASRPLAGFEAPPAEAVDGADGRVALRTGLDPLCGLALRLRIPAGGKAQLTFATAASDNAATLQAVIDKYRQSSHVQRASLMSATLTGIRLRALALSAENFAASQTLTTALVLSLTRPLQGGPAPDDAAVGPCDRRTLWRFGISGDRPILLVTASTSRGLGLLRSLAQALRLWSWGGIACDLVVVNAEPASYLMALQRDVADLRDRHNASSAAELGPNRAAATGLHLLRADELAPAELATLQALARVRIDADGRPLLHHVQAWATRHEQALDERRHTSATALDAAAAAPQPASAPVGRFAQPSGEFEFDVSPRQRPLRPWVNVLANPGFGAQLSESGGGNSWAVNSRLNQLTAWSNDPVADPPAEWFLLQDPRSMQVWSVTPSAWGDPLAVYHVSHGQGSSRISHRRGDLEVSVLWCVDAASAVKQVRLRLRNHGSRSQPLRLVGMAEWLMGAQRSDRNTVHTSVHRQRLPDIDHANSSDGVAQKLTVLLATQRDGSAGFGDGTAFLAIAGPPDDAEDWTCDRRECFDARGFPVLPDHFGQRSGAGLDPCAALSLRVVVPGGGRIDRVFLLGHGASPAAARQLAALAAGKPAAQRQAEVNRQWDQLLGAASVKTPDPLFDAMVNRWLLYQTVSCRLWAKAGFYQAGGATGFRDQLQDAMALAWAAPAMLREQIVLCASRQFAEGDVQHWWHAPQGNGVRTHFSDDLLWLAHACVHYTRATGDTALLDQRVPFIDGAAIPSGAEDVYDTPQVSAELATVYEHAARAIDRSLRVGVHGLPLMGSGDWNDGMNRVGSAGKGESVWLAWFLCQLVADFAPIARQRGELPRARQWDQAAAGWRAALVGPAWDGQWFKRAFFDDGQALGSHLNPEARIDLIAQTWAVLSKAAPPALQRIAMASVEAHLMDHEAGLIRLLDPPLQEALPSAGYIQAYPPGVRENGGQYSHAGIWALMAQAQGHVYGQGQGQGQSLSASGSSGTAPGPAPAPADAAALPGGATAPGDLAYRSFTWLSPAHRSQHPVRGAAYGIEPYVMAGDVYSQPPYVGRGGWSWYTGAAAWLHRAAIESIFGLQLDAQRLLFKPCLPSHWPRAELTLRRDGRTLHFTLIRAATPDALRPSLPAGSRLLWPGEPLAWPGLAGETHFVVPLLDATVPAVTVQATAAQPG